MPLLLMLSVEKVAMPPTAPTVRVPVSAAPGVPVPAVIATVMLLRKLVAVLPKASRAVTWIAGVIGTPAASTLGWTVKASWVAEPAVILNAVLVDWVSPLAVARRV